MDKSRDAISYKRCLLILFVIVSANFYIEACCATEMSLGDKYDFRSQLELNKLNMNSQEAYEYTKQGNMLTRANIQLTSPQMRGTLEAFLLDPSYTLSEQERQSLLEKAFSELTTNLTKNNLKVGPLEDNLDNKLLKIKDSNGKYVGSSYGYWTDQNILNIFTLKGYGSQSQTEYQLKSMKIIKKRSMGSAVSYPVSKPDQILSDEGTVLAEEGKYEEAVLYYDRAIEANPNSEDAWFNKAESLRMLGKYNESLQAFDNSIILLSDPKFSSSTYAKNMLGASLARKGEVLQKLNRDEDAKVALSKANESGYALANCHEFGLAIVRGGMLVKDSGYGSEKGLGFEAVFALAGLFAISYIYGRKRP